MAARVRSAQAVIDLDQFKPTQGEFPAGRNPRAEDHGSTKACPRGFRRAL